MLRDTISLFSLDLYSIGDLLHESEHAMTTAPYRNISHPTQHNFVSSVAEVTPAAAESALGGEIRYFFPAA
jgi:hypothetical protein